MFGSRDMSRPSHLQTHDSLIVISVLARGFYTSNMPFDAIHDVRYIGT